MYYKYFPIEFSSYENYILYLKEKGLALEAPKFRKEEKTMKAKIIKTGEIVEVYHEPQHGQITNIYKESVFVNGRIWSEDELIFLDTLEVKDVDLDLEITLWANAIPEIRLDDVERLAKYFYELELKTQKGE